jgi:hypothetical protein
LLLLIVFEVDVVLKDRVRVQLLAEARGAAHTLLIEIPFSELWRCVMLEMEFPFNVVSTWFRSSARTSSAGSLAYRVSVEKTAALMHLRRHLVELWLDGKAGGLILRGSPPVVHHYVGRLNMINATHEVATPLQRATPCVSDLERRKARERQARRAAREEHIRSYRAIDVLKRASRLEQLDHGSLNMLSGTEVSRIDQVQSTVGPKVSSALDAVIDLQDRTAGMEEIMVEVRSLDHIAALKNEIITYQATGLREIAAAQRQHAAELIRQLTHLEADVVSDLNGFKSRTDRLVLDSEMTGARLSALETLARNRHDALC